MKFSNRKAYTALVLVVVAIGVVEIGLRKTFGFCDAVLFREDQNLEYIQIPQTRKRFGNSMFYNSFSQRNREITGKDSVLAFFGDSVLNGGVLTDQDSLATTRLSQRLSVKYARPVLVLNIAAGSWGPDNCYGYLKEFGDFRTKQMVLVVSSHDAYDNMDFKKVVGVNPQYPTRQYTSAIWELLDRYFIRRYIYNPNRAEEASIDKRKANASFNPGFENFCEYTKQQKIKLVIYLHAELSERNQGAYNEQGRAIIAFCNRNNIQLIKELDYNFPVAAYQDKIHLNSIGQEKVYEVFKQFF